jgi:hypothetical protein
MLIATEYLPTPAVERLVGAWRQLYLLDLSELPARHSPDFARLLEVASPQGRTATVAKLNEQFIRIRCQMAGIETSDLYTYMPEILDCSELKQLAELSRHLYQQLFELYQQHSTQATAPGAWGIYDIVEFAKALEPKLLEFQSFHRHTKDWRAIGFLTTQLNFCNDWLLKALTPPEQQLLTPYLQFLEDYAAHPWPRVCAAAARYDLTHPTLRIVEQMIPLADDIAQSAYQRLVQAFPSYLSRRGPLHHPGIRHSCLRDLKMFQAYLWLCVLEQSTVAIETELVSLCLMVLPSLDVKWKLVLRWVQTLTEEILDRIDLPHQEAVLSCITKIEQIFVDLYYSRVSTYSRSQLNQP